MAGSVNKVILVGNLGGDPESGSTQSGAPWVRFSVATSETWRDKGTGERKEKTEWHRVLIWSEGLCKVASQYLKKGSKVYLEGSLQTRKWTDQAGVEKYTTEVVLQGFNASLTLLDKSQGGVPAPDDASRPDTGSQSRPGVAPRGSAARTAGGGNNDMDDDIPF
jgi:single-strand DNA-binding protein